MAEIVLGMGTSHGPMLVTAPETWGIRVRDDRVARHAYKGAYWEFDELVEQRKAENLAAQITLEAWRGRHVACQSAIETLADVFADVKPDIAVIVGNDQMEIFNHGLIPAFCILYGGTIINNPLPPGRLAQLPEGVRNSMPGYIPAAGSSYRGEPELGRHLIERMTADGFDVAAMSRLPADETPHAFGFVYRRIMRDDPVPSVPVLLNTFYPPNQPTVERCYEFGKALTRAIQNWESDARVALIASGGLTHFVIDESVDRTLLDAMRNRNIESVARLGETVFQDGTSEVKNWIPVAGAMATLGYDMKVVDYVPCYRSIAGTGNAMGFVYWRA